jgi:hypothetical protein
MAGASCSLTCNVKDRDGKVVVSELWKGLSKFFKGDRREALVHYFLSKDSNFLTEHADTLEFDVNGEVTLPSLKKTLDGKEFNKLDDFKTLHYLNEELKAGEYEYNTALEEVLKFNKGDQFRKGFMATLEKKDNGKYAISVVKRSEAAEYELADHLQNKILTDAVRILLKNMGLSVEFMDNPSYTMMYNIPNSYTDIDSLMCIAQVVSGLSSSEATADVAGHFLVAALESNPLIQRLYSQLTPEVQRALFVGKNAVYKRDNFVVSSEQSSLRDAAGILIGKALINAAVEHSTIGTSTTGGFKTAWRGIKNLLKKIVRYATFRFKDVSPEDIRNLIKDAEITASSAAQGFLTNPESVNVDFALNSNDVHVGKSIHSQLSDATKKNIAAYNDVVKQLRKTISQIGTNVYSIGDLSGKTLYDKLKEINKYLNANFAQQLTLESFASTAALQGIISTLNSVTELLDSDIRDLLADIKLSDRANMYSNLSSNARNMQTVSVAISNIASIYTTLRDKLDSLSSHEKMTWEDAKGNTITQTLSEAVNQLGEVLVGKTETYTDKKGKEQETKGLQGIMELKRREIFISAMEEFYGSDFVNKNAGIVFGHRGKRLILTASGDQRVAVSDLVDYLKEDISWFDRYFRSCADCGDFVTAVGDKISKIANTEADNLASKFWYQIEALRLKMQDAFGHTDCSIFYETIEDEKGNTYKTGNLISELSYGAWEKNRDEFKKNLNKEFQKYLSDLREKYYKKNKGKKDAVFSLTSIQRGILYQQFVQNKWKKWHEENSEIIKTGKGKKYLPSKSKYHSKQWDNLFDYKNPSLSSEEAAIKKKQLKMYNQIRELKEAMDRCLPDNATVPVRAPQFTGNLYHKYRNLKGQESNAGAFGRAIRRRSEELFTVKPEEGWMFGSNNEYTELSDDPMENEMFYEREKIDRLPLYGINKLPDMNNLSTDLFGTLLSYGSMAANNVAMREIADVFELGREVLRNRTVGNTKESQLKSGSSRAFTRYSKMVDKQIYGINVEVPKWFQHNAVIKFANSLANLGARILLAGNVHGGIINTGTGFLEVFKEAAAGENFTLHDLNEAHKMYFSNIVSNFMGSDGYLRGDFHNSALSNAQRKDSKNALWIRHWNILSENKDFLRGQRFDTSALNLMNNRMWEWMSHSLMLPYSTGDHYMQTIPYYAMALHTTVYDKSGKAMNLMEAYDIKDGDEVFVVDHENDKDKDSAFLLGNTPKHIELKQEIFKSTNAILKYKTVTGLLNNIEELFKNAKESSLKKDSPIAEDFYTDEQRKYLASEGFTIPTNISQLQTLQEALKHKKNELTYNSSDEAAFMAKCRSINNRLHGIYNTMDKTAFQQNFFGNLVMSMRGYALGMLNRRIGNSSFNVAQEKVTEGNLNTLAKVAIFTAFAPAFKSIATWENWKAAGEALFLTTLGQPLIFNKKFCAKVKADMKKAGFSENQFYNIKRTGMDYFILEALALLRLLSSVGLHFGLGDDDNNDELDLDKNLPLGILYYLSNRWYMEEGSYNLPWITPSEFTSLLSWEPAGWGGMKSFVQIAALGVLTGMDNLDGEPDYSNSLLYYQNNKPGVYDKGDSKAYIRFLKMVPYYRSWYVFAHPRESYKSYMYGRMVK